VVKKSAKQYHIPWALTIHVDAFTKTDNLSGAGFVVDVDLRETTLPIHSPETWSNVQQHLPRMLRLSDGSVYSRPRAATVQVSTRPTMRSLPSKKNSLPH
jgi:hypothetical protein